MSSCAMAQIIAVTNPSDLLDLATLSHLALLPDPLHAFIEKYSDPPTTIYEETNAKLLSALSEPTSHTFKAVKPVRNADGVLEGKIVGYAHWYVGYIDLPKTDPFAPVASEAGTTPYNIEENLPVNPLSDLWRRSGNLYVSTIRGKKHVYLRRMIIHPDYQRQGIGTRLLKWGLDLADSEGIVSWLFSRPAARAMYEKEGWNEVGRCEILAEDENVPPVVGMLRVPDPAKKVRRLPAEVKESQALGCED